MVGHSEVKIAAAKAWLVTMMRLGDRLDEAQGDEEMRLLFRELATVGPRLDADTELGDAVEGVLASGFLTADEMDSFSAALHVAAAAEGEASCG